MNNSHRQPFEKWPVVKFYCVRPNADITTYYSEMLAHYRLSSELVIKYKSDHCCNQINFANNNKKVNNFDAHAKLIML